MQSDRPDAGSEEFSVRLAWPKPEPAAPPDEPSDAAAPASEPGAAPKAPGAGPRAAPAQPAKPKGPTVGPASARPGGPRTDLARPAQPGATSTALELVAPAGDSNRMGRVFVEAFDRLADRLLERLRSLRQDVDADLAAVRSELSSLRQAVEDVGDRVQLRQLKTGLDELRADVNGLRRAMLEWPELQQISADLAALRNDLAFLYETSLGEEGLQAPSELLVELQEVVASLGQRAQDPMLDQPQLAVLAPLVEEVASVRAELGNIRRRLQLRAAPFDEEQLEQIVSAVAARVVDELHAGEGRRRRR